MLRLHFSPAVVLALALASFASLTSVVGCKKSSPPEGSTTVEPTSVATTRSAELSPPTPSHHDREAQNTNDRPAAIEQVAVPNDHSAVVIRASAQETKRPIVYIHGMCTEPKSDLEAWGSTVSVHGTIIALVGDATCENGKGTTWTTDLKAIDKRIDQAIAAVRASHAIDLDPKEVVLIGESMGAARATALAAELPAKYTRFVLVGAPEVPSANMLKSARAVALLAGEKEPQDKMKRAASSLPANQIHARFWSLPDATHGEYGSDGARIMSEAMAWVTSK